MSLLSLAHNYSPPLWIRTNYIFTNSTNTKQIKRESFYHHILRISIRSIVSLNQKREEKVKIGRKMEKTLIKIYKSTSLYSVFPFTHMHIDSLRFYFMLVFYFQSGNYFHFTSHPSSGIRRENDCEFRCRMFIIVSEIPHLTCITTFLSLVVSFFTLRHR